MAHKAVSTMNIILNLKKMALGISQNNYNTANDYWYMKDHITATINHDFNNLQYLAVTTAI